VAGHISGSGAREAKMAWFWGDGSRCGARYCQRPLLFKRGRMRFPTMACTPLMVAQFLKRHAGQSPRPLKATQKRKRLRVAFPCRPLKLAQEATIAIADARVPRQRRRTRADIMPQAAGLGFPAPGHFGPIRTATVRRRQAAGDNLSPSHHLEKALDMICIMYYSLFIILYYHS
jgi:hypothetical protein